MEITEIALFTLLIIIFGIPFALKVRRAAAVMQYVGYDREAYQSWMGENRQRVIEKIELIYVVSLIFFFVSSAVEGLILAVVTVLIHGVYLIRIEKERETLTYSPEMQRLIGTVYVISGLLVMVSIVLAAFTTIAAGYAVLVFLIWYAFSLVRVASGVTDPVEERIGTRTMEDAKRLVNVHPSIRIIGIHETNETEGIADLVHDHLHATDEVLALTSAQWKQEEIATEFNRNLSDHHRLVLVRTDGMSEEEIKQLTSYIPFSGVIKVEEHSEGEWVLYLKGKEDHSEEGEGSIAIQAGDDEKYTLKEQAAQKIAVWLEKEMI